MWREQQQFTFPEELGTAVDVLMADVTVSWQQVGAKLQGMYIVKMRLRFDLQPSEQVAATVVEHLDVEDEMAYFEYGVPFEREVSGSVEQLRIEQIETALRPLTISWQVQERMVQPVVEAEQEQQGELFRFSEQYVRHRFF